jgi:tripartite-type tricarboxylate transporter receptor subunit TctC
MKLVTAFFSAIVAISPAVQAQYPGKPIRIVVPFAAGGTSDILARAIGPRITEAWSQPVVVENRTGANGNVGADFVAKSAPDGYTFLLSDVGALAINPSVYPDMPFDPAKDFSRSSWCRTRRTFWRCIRRCPSATSRSSSPMPRPIRAK